MIGRWLEAIILGMVSTKGTIESLLEKDKSFWFDSMALFRHLRTHA